ncbi:MAG: hypothetical protein ACI9OJ_001628, partial [Myxococcota bacterium]
MSKIHTERQIHVHFVFGSTAEDTMMPRTGIRKALFLIGSLSLVAAIGCQSSNEGSGVDGVTGSEGATGTDGTEPVQPIG